ncbi:LytTR family DNA-binding domain-containing protein [Flavobacterium sp. GT3R68]|uniref:LytR/AlgR family response regulator transcription factor n=1 Tax=Flavobacterium sp. GT3R68 TaxID=2594437 RepID=UPI000F8735F2|nr:LytTR family DNA-binding domain-containing protein [Flavobacterium sp. GT3R68]RTY95137.1 response regulator transcription factor [Flavobacterium sp. GSN2]TRW91121.1 response regulator transcription factor [Flavobacterium sp. GT3R68]
MIPISAVIISKSKDTSTTLEKFGEENFMIMKIIGGASDINNGIDLIKSKKPDFIFLDSILEEENFFEMLGQLEFHSPKLILISEQERDAVKAFKYNATDFILKPIEFNNIILGVYKVIKTIEMERSYQVQKVNSINLLNSFNQSNEYIAVSSLDKIELIRMSDILYCQADGKYTNFYLADGKKIMSSRNLGEYSTILDSAHFFRIHHSYIINLRHIANISKKDGYFCEVSNGIILPVAKRRQEDFHKFIKLKD